MIVHGRVQWRAQRGGVVSRGRSGGGGGGDLEMVVHGPTAEVAASPACTCSQLGKLGDAHAGRPARAAVPLPPRHPLACAWLCLGRVAARPHDLAAAPTPWALTRPIGIRFPSSLAKAVPGYMPGPVRHCTAPACSLATCQACKGPAPCLPSAHVPTMPATATSCTRTTPEQSARQAGRFPPPAAVPDPRNECGGGCAPPVPPFSHPGAQGHGCSDGGCQHEGRHSG